MKRRQLIKNVAAAGIGAVVFPYINSNSYRLFAGNSRRYSARSISIVEETAVIDMLGGFQDDINKRQGKSLLETWLHQPASFTAEDFNQVKSSGIDIFAFGEMIPGFQTMVEYLARWNGHFNGRWV